MFQGLRASSPIYLFDKKNLVAETGEVVRTENPVDQFGNKVFATGLMQPKVAYIDIVALIGGKEVRFNHVSADSSISDSIADGAILCDDRQEFIDAIRSYRKTSERILNEIDTHKDIVNKCDAILADLDPRLKTEKELNARIAKLEEMLARALNTGPQNN